MERLLIFAFDKFDKLESNPSSEVAKLLETRLKGKYDVSMIVLPTTFESWNLLKKKLISDKYDLIIGLGVANRPRICIESIALNIIDSPKPDNDGKIIRHTKIDKNSSVALETKLDIVGIYQQLKEKRLPVVVSYSPDTYICNFAYFNLLNHINKNKLNTKAVFIHVPISPDEINKLDLNAPSFPPELIADGIYDYFVELK